MFHVLLFTAAAERLRLHSEDQADWFGRSQDRTIEDAAVPVLSPEAQRSLAATAPRRVFTDIDDTLHCSNGKLFHGMDTNCDASHEIYPGVAEFQLELGLGPGNSDKPPPRAVPLSARPTELRAILQLKETKPEFQHFEDVGARFEAGWGLDVGNAQYGSLTSGGSVAAGDFDKDLPFLKYTGWLNLPGPSIFVGDNGQGDVRAAQLMLAHESETESKLRKLLGAFIHHVQPRPLASELLNTSWDSGNDGRQSLLASQGIHLFHNYAHAACTAYKKGYISADGYGRVLKAVSKHCAGFQGRACQMLRPELEEDVPRTAEDCDEASLAAQPGLLSGGDVFAAAGRWMLGFCHELSSDLLQKVDASQEAFESDEVGRGYAYWALKEGLHCFTDCGQECYEVPWEQPAWRLLNTGEKAHSGICNMQRNRICKIEAA